MKDKAIAAINRHGLLSRGDNVLAGVSGGADSVSLLHFLCSISQESGIGVAAAHINHMLRGAESDRDEEFVRELCERLRVTLFVKKADVRAVAADTGKTVEEAAREVRYAFFAQTAAQNQKIATAHTLSDSVETMLINLVRGTGIRGLTGIPPVRGNIIRPLIYCTRDDIERYCALHGLDFITDSSNLSDDYTRNRIRHYVVPALTAENPSFTSAAGRAMELLRSDAEYLDLLADNAYINLSRGAALCSRELLALPLPVSSRVVIRLLDNFSVPYPMKKVERALELARAGSGSESLTAIYTLHAGNGLLKVEENTAPTPYFEHEVDTGSSRADWRYEIATGKFIKITRVTRKEFDYNYKTGVNLLKNALDCDKIGGIIKLRQRLPSDHIRLAGRGCTKTIKKLYNEAKIPPLRRSRMAVLAGSEPGLLWAEGFGAGEQAGVSPQTSSILYIEAWEDISPVSNGI